MNAGDLLRYNIGRPSPRRYAQSNLVGTSLMEIWDLHCHLSGVEGKTPDERISQIMEIADRMGVKRLVFYMGLPWANDPTPDEFRRQNDEVIQALSHWHHRAFGFVYLNPKHEEESLKELDRCVKDGPMVGIKLWV